MALMLLGPGVPYAAAGYENGSLFFFELRTRAMAFSQLIGRDTSEWHPWRWKGISRRVRGSAGCVVWQSSPLTSIPAMSKVLWGAREGR
jgi:hypothetical protein